MGRTSAAGEPAGRDARWSEALAVGSLAFVEQIKSELGISAMHRGVEQSAGTSVLREPSEAYGNQFAGENDALKPENTILWDQNAAIAET